MSVEKFLQELELPVNAAVDVAEKKFLDTVKARIQRIAESYDEELVRQEEKDLRRFHQDFFKYTLEWATREMTANKDRPNHQGAAKLKTEARQVIEGVHHLITEFAACYMHINRFTTLLRDEIRNEEERIASPAHRNIRWTADAGIVIGRYKKQRRDMLDQNARMESARAALVQIEENMAAAKEALGTLFGGEKAEKFMRSITASLRGSDFTKLARAAKDIAGDKKKFGLDQKTADAQQKIVAQALEKLTDLVKENAKDITNTDGKLYLRVAETEAAHNSNIQELRKIKLFLGKYQLPYMQYKLDMLAHLKDKLMVVGSLDSLMILYHKLVAGLVMPLADIKAVREYESDVLGHSKYLIQGLGDEIPKIVQRANETVDEFRQNCAEFAEVENLHLEEIAGGGNSGTAQASG